MRDPNGKMYTINSLSEALYQNYENGVSPNFRELLVKWCKTLVAASELDWKRISEETEILLLPLLDAPAFPREVDEFMSVPDADLKVSVGKLPSPNVYIHKVNGTEIQIELDTIHGVKGQTHTATLLLETYFRTHDLPALLPYLKGKPPRKTPNKTTLSRLPLAYVAMTRPTHLLCLAMHADHVSENDLEELREIGWNIERL